MLVAFTAYIGRFYTRLDSMSRMVAATQRAGGQRAADFRDPRPRAQRARADQSRLAARTFRGEIELQNVGFRYGNRPVVEG